MTVKVPSCRIISVTESGSVDSEKVLAKGREHDKNIDVL